MDVRSVCDAVEVAANASERAAAGRLLLVYIAPGDTGLYVFRPGCGLHQVGGPDDAAGDFGASMRAAVEKLWPESSKKTRQWLRIACDFLARSPIAKMIGGGETLH